MKTSKPISTVSYNSPDFLSNLILTWKRSGIIDFGMWILHKAEEGEKDHFHVFLKPSKLIQTSDLEKESCEFVPTHPKPLKMIPFCSSKEDDWVLYTLHDPDYLASKGLVRLYSYSLEDYSSTDSDCFADIVSRVHDNSQGKIEYRLIQLIRSGLSWDQIVLSGFIPLRYITGAKIMYDSLKKFNT